MSSNLDFVSTVWCIKLEKHKPLLTFSGLPIYSWVIIRRIFSLKKISLDICELLDKKSHWAWSLFIKHNSLKSGIFFNPTHVYSIFSRIHVFQGSSFSGFMFFRVQVFKGLGLSGSGSSVRIQVLEVALCIYMQITLRHRYSPENLLHISEHLFIRTTSIFYNQ